MSSLEGFHLYRSYTLHFLPFRYDPGVQKPPTLIWELMISNIYGVGSFICKKFHLNGQMCWVGLSCLWKVDGYCINFTTKAPLWCDGTGLWIITAVGTLCSEVARPGKWKHMVGCKDHRRASEIMASQCREMHALPWQMLLVSLQPAGITNAVKSRGASWLLPLPLGFLFLS